MKAIRQIAATGSVVWQVLGALVATATVVSLIKSGFSIDFSGLPAKVFQHYEWLRDSLLWPVSIALREFGYVLTSTQRDLLMAYGLIAGAHYRAFDGVEGYAEARAPGEPKVLYSLFWPISQLRWQMRQWRYSRTSRRLNHKLIGTEHLTPGENSVVDYEMALQYASEDASIKLARYLTNLRTLVVTHVIVATAVAIVFFAWDHVAKVFGPN
jgi:hypothetical protein